MKIIKDTLSLIKLFYFKYVIISGNIFHNQINSLHFNRNFKIVERNLLYKYVDRSLPKQLPEMIIKIISESKIN